MMTHTQLTELFNFIDLETDAKRQKNQLHEETDGLLKLEKYAAQHHHMLITSDDPPQVDILNLSMLKQPNDKLSPDDKVYLIEYAMKEWIEWEKESKIIYEDAYRSLVEISEIAAADFVLRYVRDQNLVRIGKKSRSVNINLDILQGIIWIQSRKLADRPDKDCIINIERSGYLLHLVSFWHIFCLFPCCES